MNSYFFNISLLCMIALVVTSLNAQEVPTLRPLALNKATDHFYEQLKKQKTISKKEELIEKWEAKSGLVKPKGDTTQQTILERFEQKYFTKLVKFKTFENQIIALTSDNTRVILRDHNKNLILLDLQTNKPVHTLKTPNYYSNVVLNSDNSKAVSFAAHDLQLWDLTTGKIIHTLKGHTHIVEHLAVNADFSKAISAGRDCKIILWDLNEGKAIEKYIDNRPAKHIKFIADNDRTFIHSSDHALTVWYTGGTAFNRKTDLEIWEKLYHHKTINCLAVNSDNSKAISGSDDRTLKLWNLNNGAKCHTLKGHKDSVTQVALTTCGSKAISGSYDGNLILWDLNQGLPIRIFKGPKKFVNQRNWNGIYKLALSSDSNRAVSTSRDETVILWDLKTGNKLYQTKSSDSTISPLIINNNLVASGTTLFKTEDWKSIIANMPQPNPIFDITMNILNLQQATPLTGISQVGFLKQKKASKSVTQKIMTTIHYFKNRIVSLYK